MNAPESIFLPDIQSIRDHRALAIEQVGICGLRYPLTWRGADGTVVATVATLALSVGLPAEQKGTHMSRFVELVEAKRDALDLSGLRTLFADMLARLGATSGRLEAAFPWFIRKRAPVSGVESLLDIDAALRVEQPPGGRPQTTMRVVVPVTSLCPCSKEISAYGAHNQRSQITLEVVLREDMSFEELVRIAEEEASCELFGLLKRPDEKWVTERAYDNPKFVEDLVRDIALRLRAEPRIAAWQVASENFESIHNHSAWATISGANG
ncbi:GTP cyclohydrolase I FolE2 [Zoogloeaceae bacteirum Par-f-2]|nr:GTP cyclohydrolase I FolE2 [Zoogloeaceae bacteirum Par-f-2]